MYAMQRDQNRVGSKQHFRACFPVCRLVNVASIECMRRYVFFPSEHVRFRLSGRSLLDADMDEDPVHGLCRQLEVTKP